MNHKDQKVIHFMNLSKQCSVLAEQYELLRSRNFRMFDSVLWLRPSEIQERNRTLHKKITEEKKKMQIEDASSQEYSFLLLVLKLIFLGSNRNWDTLTRLIVLALMYYRYPFRSGLILTSLESDFSHWCWLDSRPQSVANNLKIRTRRSLKESFF